MMIATAQESPNTNENNPKLFGRYHEVVLLLIGFLLTTIVGGLLTYWYQTLAWNRDDIARRKSEELTRASALFEDVSRRMDRRLYRLRNVEDALEEKLSSAELDKRRAQYRAAVADWNESLNRNLWATQRYFGTSLRSTLEGTIQEGFRSLHQELAETLGDRTEERINKLKAHINDFNPSIYMFDGEMLDALQCGSVGTFRQSSTANQ
jgi:hypothetical protein